MKSDAFLLESLGLWTELIMPKLRTSSLGAPGLAETVEEAEEAATAATFKQVLAQIAADEKEYVGYRLSKTKSESRRHVLMVVHNKEQQSKGQLSGTWLYGSLTICGRDLSLASETHHSEWSTPLPLSHAFHC